MKKDLSSRRDIEQLVDLFYEKVKEDKLISRFFTTVIKVSWEKHLPIMYDFWSNVVFSTGNYGGHPMKQHLAIHARSPLTKVDFEHWNNLFNTAVDELFAGENAETIKQRAQNISSIMQLKILQKK